MVQYKKKCELCKEYFQPEHANIILCDDCKKKIKINNNKKGYNRYKKAKKKVKEVIKISKEELTKELGELFHKQWTLKREVLSLGHKIEKINKELIK